MSEHDRELADWHTLLEELTEFRKRLDALEVKRASVFAAMDEVDGLQVAVADSTKKIKEHLREAL